MLEAVFGSIGKRFPAGNAVMQNKAMMQPSPAEPGLESNGFKTGGPEGDYPWRWAVSAGSGGLVWSWDRLSDTRNEVPPEGAVGWQWAQKNRPR
jgi:hypothetical protein